MGSQVTDSTSTRVLVYLHKASIYLITCSITNNVKLVLYDVKFKYD